LQSGSLRNALKNALASHSLELLAHGLVTVGLLGFSHSPFGYAAAFMNVRALPLAAPFLLRIGAE
jgi:hypothetical protein